MATPIFCCGFECGQIGGATPTLGRHWGVGTGTAPTIDTGTVRSGARSLRCTAAAGTAVAPSLTYTDGSVVGRVYLRFASLPTADTYVLKFSGGEGLRYAIADSKLYCHAGAVDGATGVSVTTNTWYRLDVRLDKGTFKLDAQVDGTALGDVDFSAGAQTTISLGVIETATADIYYDDVILSQTLADYPLGAGEVFHFVPTADGTHNVAGTADFRRTLTATDILNATTTAFQLVDDVPLESGASVDWITMLAPPNATDYVECIFGPAPGISAPTTGPRFVEVIAAIHQAGTGAGNMEIRMNDNGTLDAMYSATGVAGIVTITYKRKGYAVAIAGGGAWVIGGGGNGDFTDLRVRFGSPAALDVNPDQFFDCIMIEAEFAPAVVVERLPTAILVTQAVQRAANW
jgi:hypothetical protein